MYFPNTSTIRTRFANERGILVVLLVTMMSGAPAQEFTNISDSNNIVSFFKQAIRQPFNVEEFTGSQTMEQSSDPKTGKKMGRTVTYYRGARSSTNFFLVTYAGTNRIIQFVSGRSGNEMYFLNGNTLTRSFDPADAKSPNPSAVLSDAMRKYACQFLNMGMADLNPESVVWRGNEFEAVRNGNIPLHGRLELSNGIPARLLLSPNDHASAERRISYIYPNPPDSIGCFPSQITLWTKGEVWRGDITMELDHVKIVSNELGNDFFASTQFEKNNIKYFNFETNRELSVYALTKEGTPVKLQTRQSLVGVSYGPKPHNSLSRFLVVGFLMATSTLPIFGYGVIRLNKKRKKQ